MTLNIVLASVESELADAWQRFCGDLDGVSIHRGSILDVHCEAIVSPANCHRFWGVPAGVPFPRGPTPDVHWEPIVSPANSFGFMDGGIDPLYSRHFGWHVQRRLQDAIRTRHHGELLVGSAEIVPTDD